MGALIVLVALAIAVFMWWLRILVTLLREGPSESSDGWLASVIIVTVLGPLGALVYLATRPDRHTRSPRPELRTDDCGVRLVQNRETDRGR